MQVMGALRDSVKPYAVSVAVTVAVVAPRQVARPLVALSALLMETFDGSEVVHCAGVAL